MTNHLAVTVGGLRLIGLRAPAYTSSKDWFAYWGALRLEADLVIGDLNVDPMRGSGRDRVLPTGWTVITPAGCSFRSNAGAESTLDHALLRRGLEVRAAAYRPEFFGRWGLDHCPLVVDLVPPAAPHS